MNIEIIKGAPEPGRDYDTVVLIDVFRASSTMVCLLANGVNQIVLASTFDAMSPTSTWQSDTGSRVEYFSDTEHPLRSRDNSPTEALQLDATQVQRVVIVSRNGTKVPSWIRSCNELIVCSFLNLHAVAEHIVSRTPRDVAIIAIGHIRIPEEAEEDNLCAYALRDLLRSTPIDEDAIRKALKRRIEETRRDPNAPQGERIEIDRAICCGISLFDVVPTINKQGDGFVVEVNAKPLDAHIDRPDFTADEARALAHELVRFHRLAIPNDAIAIDLQEVMRPYRDLSLPERGDWVLLASTRSPSIWGEFWYPLRESFGRAWCGPKEVDLAGIFCDLLLSCGGSVHRASNICRAFLGGYDATYRYDVFFRLLINKLLMRLNGTQELKNYYRDNRQQLRQVLESLSTGPVVAAPALIRHLCEKTNNNGKLDGRVSAHQEIIYQKRDGNEFSVNLTNRCPNACVFCIRDFSPGWQRPKSPDAPPVLYLASEPEIEEVIGAARAELERRDPNLLQVMKFCGYGEPLLRPDVICEVSKQIKQEYGNVRIQVNTTGWPYYKHCFGAGYSLSRLKESGVDMFSVSLNAPNEKLYSLLTRPGVFEAEGTAFERTLEFIAESVKHGFETKASVVELPKLSPEHIQECDALVRTLGATLVVRPFVGKVESLSQDTFGTEVEAKLFDIDRNQVRNILSNKGAKKLGSGLAKIVIYDIPADLQLRRKIRELIEVNPPEHRRFHLLMKEVAQRAATRDTLADRLGFLRVMKDFAGTRLLFREPTSITSSTKKEKELAYPLESMEDGIALLERLGLQPTRQQEKSRESYELYDVRYHLDTWPGMSTYLKVEAFDDVAIYRGVMEIGYDPRLMRGEHAEHLFKVSGIDPTHLKFSDEELVELELPPR